jgi:hypothetical protein
MIVIDGTEIELEMDRYKDGTYLLYTREVVNDGGGKETVIGDHVPAETAHSIMRRYNENDPTICGMIHTILTMRANIDLVKGAAL